MRGQLHDPQGAARTIETHLQLTSFAHRPLVIYGMIVLGSVFTLFFILIQLGVNLPTIISGMFGSYKVDLAGVMMMGVGSSLGRFWKKFSDEGESGGFEADIPTPTLLLPTMRSNTAWLVVRSGINPSHVLDVQYDSVIVGNGVGSEVRIEDESICESHALFKKIDGSRLVSGPVTPNGTWVNGHLQSGVILQGRIDITIGNTKITFYRTSSQVEDGGLEEPQTIGGTMFARAVPNSGENFQIRPGDTVSGSDPDSSDINLDDQTVSRRYVMLGVLSRVCRPYDLGSTNGTEVDGNPLDDVPLKDRDVIKFGKVEVRFVRNL